MESIQNPQTSRNQPQKVQKPHTFSQWVQKYFQQHCSLCTKQNPSIFICSSTSCLIPNPFICGKPQCQCLHSHSTCTIRSITPLLKQIQTKQTPTEQLVETIQSTMNEIIDIVSTSKQQILKLLREGMINSAVEDIGEIREYNIQSLFEKDLRGNILGQLVNYNEETNAEEKRFHTFKVQTAKILRDFKQNNLKPFLSHLIQKFFSQNNYFFWQPSLKQPSITMTKTHIINKSTDKRMKLCLLSPGISKLYGPTFRWRIKIIKITGEGDSCISLGIGLLEQIKKRNFIFNEGQNYSCYMITNNGKTYSAFDYIKDNQINYGFEFITNDVILLQLDTKQWVIRFKNERTLKSTELKIQKIPQPSHDDYHICIGSNTKDTQVEVISPIETEVANYMICA